MYLALGVRFFSPTLLDSDPIEVGEKEASGEGLSSHFFL